MRSEMFILSAVVLGALQNSLRDCFMLNAIFTHIVETPKAYKKRHL